MVPPKSGQPAKSRTQRRHERQRRRYHPWFHQYEVEYFIRAEYPGCPEFAVVYFATSVCQQPKNWQRFSMAAAVDYIMQCHLRHEHTDYDHLLMVGIRRKEARLRIQPKVDAMIAGWRERPILHLNVSKCPPADHMRK